MGASDKLFVLIKESTISNEDVERYEKLLKSKTLYIDYDENNDLNIYQFYQFRNMADHYKRIGKTSYWMEIDIKDQRVLVKRMLVVVPDEYGQSLNDLNIKELEDE